MQLPEQCKNQVGAQLKSLAHATVRLFSELARREGLDEMTLINGRIMGLIYFNPDRDIFQKDVEESFNINRSSVTSVVKLMEKKGYIERHPVPGDARLKKLTLTPAGAQAHLRVLKVLSETEEILSRNLTDEELSAFFAVTDKMADNIESIGIRGGKA